MPCSSMDNRKAFGVLRLGRSPSLRMTIVKDRPIRYPCCPLWLTIVNNKARRISSADLQHLLEQRRSKATSLPYNHDIHKRLLAGASACAHGCIRVIERVAGRHHSVVRGGEEQLAS